MPSSDAPIEIGRVTLTVRDLAAMSTFYQEVLGLHPMAGDASHVSLGVGDRVLIELRADPAARRASRREAGLFHIAFLLPTRHDLAAWLRHVAERGIHWQGASDHLVSEAMYLADPEGNGIEVYADRPRASWRWQGTEIAMDTQPLDLQALAARAQAPWRGAPEGSVIGHVHLQTGALEAARQFYTEDLGFDLTCTYRGALFFGSGGYHHHLATNIWNSWGAGPRDPGATGIAEIELRLGAEAPEALRARIGTDLADPWGIRYRLAAQP
ncbi:MAG: VOC family protein [Salipiger marinus]|uniref:VOC family protein n=1 Tax=Salipiger marinus TaxID=555512 RepID=UPI004059B236